MNVGVVSELTVPVGQSIERYIAGQPHLVVVPNMGNAGDALINYAMYAMLRKRSIPFVVIEADSIKQPDPGTTYLLMVNGALHHAEHAMDRLIHLMSRHNSKMIFHSATIQDRDELLRHVPESTVIIAREPITYRYVRSVRPGIESVLSEDATMAIADGDADYPTPGFSLRLQYRLRIAYQAMRYGYPPSFALSPLRYRNGLRNGETFYALRTDDEKVGDDSKTPGNVDLSLVCGGRQTLGHAEASAALLLKVIRAKKAIRTDRLHVAIGCCLMNVECLFSANSYFKCEAIYNHSLARRFPKIKWI